MALSFFGTPVDKYQAAELKANLAEEAALSNASAESKRKKAQEEYMAGATEISNKRSNLSGLLDQITKESTEEAIDANNRQFGAARGRLLSEQAALGRSTQPAAQYNIRSLEGSNQKNISDLIKSITNTGLEQKYNAGNQSITDLLNSYSTASGFGERAGNTSLSQDQSNQEYLRQLEKDKEERDLAMVLGRMEAEKNKPGLLDYINTGFQGVNAGANLTRAIRNK